MAQVQPAEAPEVRVRRGAAVQVPGVRQVLLAEGQPEDAHAGRAQDRHGRYGPRHLLRGRVAVPVENTAVLTPVVTIRFERYTIITNIRVLKKKIMNCLTYNINVYGHVTTLNVSTNMFTTLLCFAYVNNITV